MESKIQYDPNGSTTYFANVSLANHLSALSLLVNKGTKSLLPGQKAVVDDQFSVVSDPLIRAGTILSTNFLSDITFVVGQDKVEIEAHKFMLASASEVFCTMFNGSLPEGNFVKIPDCNPEAFCLMLQYIYMGIVPKALKAELGLEVYDLARKYLLKSYEEHVAMVLINSATTENVLIILGTFILYDLPKLEVICWKYIDINIRIIIHTEHFKDIDIETLCKLVQRDSLQISELDLFSGVLVWGRAEVERRDQIPTIKCLQSALVPCLKHIRFPTMKASDFANEPGRSGILEKYEVGEILLYICSTAALKPPCRWPTTQRPFNIELIDLTQDSDPAVAPEASTCECSRSNENCFFCFGRQRVQDRASARLSAGIGNVVSSHGTVGFRGRGRAHGEPQRAFTANATPQPYCHCRVRGNCPVKVGLGDQLPPSVRPVSAVSRSNEQIEQLHAPQPLMGRVEREADLRRDIIDRAIQRRQRQLHR